MSVNKKFIREKLWTQIKTLEDVNIDDSTFKSTRAQLKKKRIILEYLEELINLEDDISSLREISEEESLMEEINLETKAKEEILQTKTIEWYNLITYDSDEKSIMMEIRSGTGGDEAAIFAYDLLKMYTKYIENKKWIFEVLTISENEAKGIRSITINIKGEGVYRRFFLESGVHRVQRIPTTEANGRIHTSTATVVVLKEPKDVEISVLDKDLRIDVYRASGAGGQHVNKTESAVRITHLATNIVVQCQDERSQLENKMRAMKILKIRLYALEKEKIQNERNEQRQKSCGSGERNEKSRTYNFPQNRITDHRFNITLNQLNILMEGDLDDFLLKLQVEYQKEVLQGMIED